MYYVKTISDRIRVPPAYFGSTLEDAILKILRERYEGRIYKDLGIVLSIDDPKILSDGAVIPGDAGAYFTIEFDALAFLPSVNEVYRAEIKEIVEFGAFASIGPFQGLLHVSQIDREKFYYEKKSKTLSSKTLKRAIKKGDDVLVKVSTVSLKTTSSDTKIGLTMRPDGLGRDDWISAKPVKKPIRGKKGGNR
ncbi:MAG: DNA-directed RNA polymerase [Candidatus Micrarchaeota archaeon]|nr:DNA-directed RNA polymerase [Candidatus Micrarchaeota archaeon]MBU1682013.1 DNA-directed RNA polymerase [Candidatus Micrarchaeota archaeon]